MRTLTSVRKAALASFVVILCSGSCRHGLAQSSNNEAVKQKKGSFNNSQEIRITALAASPIKMGKDPGK